MTRVPRLGSMVALLALLVLASSACAGNEKPQDEPTGPEGTPIGLTQYVAGTLAELAENSDLVVIAEVHEVTREEVKLPSPMDPSFESTRGDIVVLATIREVVWGDAAGLPELKLHSAEWFEVPDSDDPSQVTRIDFPALPMPEAGQTIVAFLRTNNGEVEPTSFAVAPGFGVLGGETVTFPTVELDTDGPVREITIPAATLDEIREAMDRGARRTTVDREDNDDWKAVIELGERQDALMERAREGADPEELRDYAFSLGLTPGSWPDASACRKFEAVIANSYGIPVDLECQAVWP